MAIQKFKPIIWTTKFNEDLEKKLVLKEDCNLDYEGDAKEPGDTVKILGLGDPTLAEYSDGKLHEVEFEDIEDDSQTMPILQVVEFGFKVDDLDKRQAQGGSGLLGKYMEKAKNKCATAMDSYIARLCADERATAYVPQANATAGTEAGRVNELTILDDFSKTLTMLLERDVSRDDFITWTIAPWMTEILKRAYVELDTDNSEMMKNGKVGRYSNVIIKESNNLYVDEDGFYHMPLRTKNAVAFVNPHTHMEPLRLQNSFHDAVKGYSVFDGKVIRSKEIIDFKVKRA